MVAERGQRIHFFPVGYEGHFGCENFHLTYLILAPAFAAMEEGRRTHPQDRQIFECSRLERHGKRVVRVPQPFLFSRRVVFWKTLKAPFIEYLGDGHIVVLDENKHPTGEHYTITLNARREEASISAFRAQPIPPVSAAIRINQTAGEASAAAEGVAKEVDVPEVRNPQSTTERTPLLSVRRGSGAVGMGMY